MRHVAIKRNPEMMKIETGIVSSLEGRGSIDEC